MTSIDRTIYRRMKRSYTTKELIEAYRGSRSRWTFSIVKAINWLVKRIHIAADKTHSSQCLMV
jgi:hypothetical protein